MHERMRRQAPGRSPASRTKAVGEALAPARARAGDRATTQALARPHHFDRMPVQAPASGPGAALPDRLRAGVERLSGLSMADARVHYGSDRPAGLGALAYTQGAHIHLGPGQERHLPHEAWHVVQQKQGRVRPTHRFGGVAINDGASMEREADLMGARAARSAIGPLPPLVEAASTPAAVQRKVGFEFEDAAWKPWISTFLWGGWFRERYWRSPTDNQGVRPAGKKEVLHQGDGFTAEGDLYPPVANLEFVTEPFSDTEPGRARLNGVLDRIETIYRTLAPMRGRKHEDGEFVTAQEARFSNPDALLSKGHSRGLIKMQATHGVALEDIPALMQYFGTRVPGETPAEETQRRGARQAQYGKGSEDPNDFWARLLGQSPAMADELIRRLRNHGSIARRLGRDSRKLRGFLALVLNYLRSFGFNPAEFKVGDYEAAKHRTVFMARTDLGHMFQALLPAGQRDALRDNANFVINELLGVANAFSGAGEVRYRRKGTLLRNVRSDRQDGSTVPELEIEDWLTHIFRGQDLLTGERIGPWLQQVAPRLSAAEIEDRTERARGLGALGQKTDTRRVRGRRQALPILENRRMTPVPDLTGMGSFVYFDEARKVADAYMRFMIALRGGAPGRFPRWTEM